MFAIRKTSVAGTCHTKEMNLVVRNCPEAKVWLPLSDWHPGHGDPWWSEDEPLSWSLHYGINMVVSKHYNVIFPAFFRNMFFPTIVTISYITYLYHTISYLSLNFGTFLSDLFFHLLHSNSFAYLGRPCGSRTWESRPVPSEALPASIFLDHWLVVMVIFTDNSSACWKLVKHGKTGFSYISFDGPTWISDDCRFDNTICFNRLKTTNQ